MRRLYSLVTAVLLLSAPSVAQQDQNTEADEDGSGRTAASEQTNYEALTHPAGGGCPPARRSPVGRVKPSDRRHPGALRTWHADIPSPPMTVLVAGAHGDVGQHLVQILARAGHTVRGMIRDADQSDLLRRLGAEPVVADLTGDVSDAPAGVDAVVFAAGSGGNDVEGVDRDGAIRLIDATEAQGVTRFVMLSSIGADDPEAADELQDYLRAKHAADAHLLDAGLVYTILRPTTLTNGAPLGTAAFAESLDFDEHPRTIARADVASALAACLTTSETEDAVIEMTAGTTPIREGLAAT